MAAPLTTASANIIVATNHVLLRFIFGFSSVRFFVGISLSHAPAAGTLEQSNTPYHWARGNQPVLLHQGIDLAHGDAAVVEEPHVAADANTPNGGAGTNSPHRASRSIADTMVQEIRLRARDLLEMNHGD
jgi:hypothetical protein